MPARTGWPTFRRMALRFAVIAILALCAHGLIGLSMTLTGRLPSADADAMRSALLLMALLIYALLIAIPFVPGIEIGVALLLLRGASIAPAVYLATVTGLLLAYCIGRAVPDGALARLLSDLRMRRAGEMVARLAGMSPEARARALEARLPRWLALPVSRYRYLSLGLLLNVPGNVLLGGGGGLMMAAGLSRLFAAHWIALTVALAVLPVPLMIWWFGTGMLTWPPGPGQTR